jgi:hypothetical protein
MRLGKYLKEIKDYGSNIEQLTDILRKDCDPFLRETKRVKDFVYRGVRRVKGSHPMDGLYQIKPRKDRKPVDIPIKLHDEFDELFRREFGWNVRSEGIFATGKRSTASGYGDVYLFFPIGRFDFIWSPYIKDLYDELEAASFPDDEFYPEDYDEEYERKYGEASGDGHYLVQGNEYETLEDAIDDIMRELEENENWEFNNKKELRDEAEDMVYNDLEWVPSVSFDDWWIDKLEELRNEREGKFIEIVGSYKNNNLSKAIKSDNEIMFKCKKYYLVNSLMYNLSEIKKLLWYK